MAKKQGWQVSNSAARYYESHVTQLMEIWVERLIADIGLLPGESVLDIACGTGQLTRLAAEKVGTRGRVVGFDLNAGMLEAARQLDTTSNGITVEWKQGDVLDLPFADNSFTAVTCQQGMQFFSDSHGALRQMHRVLRSGGRVGFTVWAPIEQNPYFEILARMLERHVGEQAAAGVRSIFSLSEPEQLQSLLQESGYRDTKVNQVWGESRTTEGKAFVPGHLLSLPMADQISTLDEEATTAFVEDFYKELAPYEHSHSMIIPASCYVAIGTAG